MKPEQAYKMDAFPCNPFPFLARIKEIFNDAGTNNFQSLTDEDQQKIKACLFVVNSLVFGQLFSINAMDEFNELLKGEKNG